MAEEPAIKKIGRYEIVRKIATGGMAELFLARFVGPGGFEKRCALKRILPQFAADQVFTRMFLNEARVTAMFDHPNLVQIFELGQDDHGQFYIAMELVNGLNLRQLNLMCAEKGILIPPELAAYMVSQALDGLEYAHNFKDPAGQPLNLVHRDISPQNILVSYEGAVKLVDFGIVKGSSISGETQAGMLKGKVAYMSPEQASGEAIDRRSDLFSLGVCFYELVVGERPFQGANEIMTLKSILEEAPLPVTSFVPDCPIGLERSIYKSLEKNPADRFRTAREFQTSVQAVLKDCPLPLGRHVVAEFMQSLTESDTDSAFDSTRLKIPRYGVGFGHGSLADSSGEISAVLPPSTPYQPAARPSSRPSPAAISEKRRAAGHEQPYTPTPTADHSHVSTMSGIASEVRAAGLERRISGSFLGVFAASAIIGAAGVFFVTRQSPIVVTAVDPPGLEAVVPPPAIERPPPARPVDIPPPPAAPPTVAPPPAAPPPPAVAKTPRHDGRSGRIDLGTTPKGLTVRLGRKKLGTTPLEARLPPGTHALELASASLGIKRKIVVTIEEGKTTSERVVFQRGTVRVVSRPVSTVYADGVAKGVTPIQFALYEGEHTLRFVSESSGEQVRVIHVKAGEEQLIPIKF
jgi:serine/threonine-protein kinase